MASSRKQPTTLADYTALFKETYQEWTEDKAPRLGAALAYYAIFSLSPLLVVVIAIAGFVFGEEAARGEVAGQISRVVGPQAAQFIQSMLQSADKPSSSIMATIIGLITLVMGAMGVFGQLQDAMNTIWEIEPKPKQSWQQQLKDRLTPFVVLMGAAFLMLVSLAASSAINVINTWATNYLPLPSWVLQILNLTVSLGIVTILFALIFRVLPDAEIEWHDVWVGAFFTALLFTLGQLALAWYIGKTASGSTYGAAGSLVAVLVWVYWASQIVFFGAEFTQVYSNKYGSRVLAGSNADTNTALFDSPMSRATPPSPSGNRPTPPRGAAKPAPTSSLTPTSARNELMEDWGAILAGVGLAFILHRLFRKR